MGLIEKTVFISYRRANVSWALAIFQDLTEHGFDVFFDFTGIASGDFESVILENIKARAHFVVLLTPSALERCCEQGDWLRREIETALEVERNIVPLMLEGFDFSTPKIASQLNGRLAELKEYNGLDVPAPYFAEAMMRLRDHYLNVSLDAVLHPPSEEAQRAARNQQSLAATAAAVPKPKPVEPESSRGEATSGRQRKHFSLSWAGQFGRIRWRILASSLAVVVAAGLGIEGLSYYRNRPIATAIPNPSPPAVQDNAQAAAAPNMGAPPVQKAELTAEDWFERGRKSTDPDQKLAYYSEALRLNPDYAEAFRNRGNVRKDKGDLDGALKDYNEAIRLKPVYADVFNGRGVVLRQKGDLDGALKDYNEAIRLKPDYTQAFNNLGNVRRDKGDLDGALKDYNEAIHLQPDYALALSNRAVTRKDKGDLDGALKDYNEVIRLRPDDANAFNNRGLVRKNEGDLNGALQDYNEAIRLKPDYADAFYNRGIVRQNQGNRAGAAADYQKYLDLGGGKREGDRAKIEQLIRNLKKHPSQ